MKVAIVTGGSTGMGLETVKALALENYCVIIGCLNLEKAAEVIETLPAMIKGNVVLKSLDLSDMSSVQQFAEEVKKEYEVIDVLVNNAGVLNPVIKTTLDGIDYTIAANYLGHYLLTHLLIDRFIYGSRIVNITSLTYSQGKIDYDFFLPKSSALPAQFSRYYDSKLAVMYATLDLAERLKEQGVYVNAVDPGVVGTNIVAMNYRTMDVICDYLFRPFVKTPKEGANSAIFLALHAHEKNITSQLLKDKKIIKQSSKLSKEQQEYIKKLTINFLNSKNIII